MKMLLATLAVLGLTAAGAATAQESDPLRKAAATPIQRTAFPEMTSGEAVYKGVCQGCHMADAKGAQGAGAYPALAGDDRLGTAAYPLMVVVGGQKAMPAFGEILSDAQISGVVEYVRTHFGNAYKEKVAPGDVAEIRAALRH